MSQFKSEAEMEAAIAADPDGAGFIGGAFEHITRGEMKDVTIARLEAEVARLTTEGERLGRRDALWADARRWRVIEKTMEEHDGTTMLSREMNAHPDQRYVVGAMGRYSSGHYEMLAREATLAAAVDALAEAQEKA